MEVQAHWWAHSTQCLCYHTTQANPTFLPTALSKSDFRGRLPSEIRLGVQRTVGFGKWRCRRIGKYTVPNTYVAR